MPSVLTAPARTAITDRFPRSKNEWFELIRLDVKSAVVPRRHRIHDRRSKMCGIVF